MPQHLLSIENTEELPQPDGSTVYRVTFGCSCGTYAGDQTVGSEKGVALDRAMGCHATHRDMAISGRDVVTRRMGGFVPPF